jgi:CheY-like chemotaxis protein
LERFRDLVLTDLRMPRLDGICLSALRRFPAPQCPTCVFMTGDASGDDGLTFRRIELFPMAKTSPGSQRTFQHRTGPLHRLIGTTLILRLRGGDA